MEIDKDFIPYEQALALKELGFDKPCFGRYWHEDFKFINIDKQFEKPDYVCLAPLYQQAFRWFREKYNLEVSFYRTMETIEGLKYGYQIERWESETTEDLVNLYEKSYEEAELACLKKLIEIIKNK